MPDDHSALVEAHAAVRRALAAVEAAMGGAGPGVPLKRAAHEMGITEAALRKRAQRGDAGFKVGEDWYFSADYIAAEKSRHVQAPGHAPRGKRP